jgi:hypothetical protein
VAISPRNARHVGRTRWKRLPLVLVPTLAASVALFVAMADGALAASFGVSANSFSVFGGNFKLSADPLVGLGFVTYGVLDHDKQGEYPEVLSGVRSADLHHLCQSVVQQVPFIGPVTIRLTAGFGGIPAHADRLVADAHDLRGDVIFHHINIGQDASTVDEVPGVYGEPGGFAEQAAAVRIDHLRQLTRSVSAATFRLPGLHLTVDRGDRSCF